MTGEAFFTIRYPPNQQNWVETVFLGSPVNVMGNMKYDRQETLLEPS